MATTRRERIPPLWTMEGRDHKLEGTGGTLFVRPRAGGHHFEWERVVKRNGGTVRQRHVLTPHKGFVVEGDERYRMTLEELFEHSRHFMADLALHPQGKALLQDYGRSYWKYVKEAPRGKGLPHERA
jgi:hypothetical protein